MTTQTQYDAALTLLYPTAKWVRAMFANMVVADSKSALLWRGRGQWAYCFPQSSVRMDVLAPSALTTKHDVLGVAKYWSVKVGDRIAEDAAFSYTEPPSQYAALKDRIAFKWGKMDAWYEENEEVFVHPRDPYHRVDVMNSTRHIKVIVGGQVVAESRAPVLLFETGLPTRYYLPKLDVRQEILRPSNSLTRCPYKGDANYYSVEVGGKLYKDLIWYYRHPLAEAGKIANLLCFYNEKVDGLYVDNEPEARPKTQWS